MSQTVIAQLRATANILADGGAIRAPSLITLIELLRLAATTLEAAAKPPEMQTGRDAVLAMRDDFKTLVNAYNAINEYADALDAQAMVIALNKFEDDHHITNMLWPARIEMVDGHADIVDKPRAD